VLEHIDTLLPGMPTNDMAGPAWRDHGQIHVVDSLDAAFALADQFASEHVQILTADPRQALGQDAELRRAVPRRGHLRLLRRQGDRHQPRAPHPGAARYTGGLWVGKYLKTVTYQEVTDTGHQRPAGRAVRSRLAGRALRGPRALR
jgi:sulfopropanediol 3-dehydrogenase